MDLTTTHLDHLAHRIDQRGMTAVDAELRTELAAVVTAAERAGVPSVLLAVLTDTTQPAIARARAFGATAARLAAGLDEAVRPSDHGRRLGPLGRVDPAMSPAAPVGAVV